MLIICWPIKNRGSWMYTRIARMILGAALLCAGCVATTRNGDGDSPDLVLRVTDSNGTVTELAHAQILKGKRGQTLD
jgi:hypothetical protein